MKSIINILHVSTGNVSTAAGYTGTIFIDVDTFAVMDTPFSINGTQSGVITQEIEDVKGAHEKQVRLYY